MTVSAPPFQSSSKSRSNTTSAEPLRSQERKSDVLIQEQAQQHVAAAGATVTIGGFAGFMAAAEPVLRQMSLTLSVLVGICTLVWYGIKFYDKWKSRKS